MEVEDVLNFRMALYVDSFAEGSLVPVCASQVVFVIDKDFDGSDLDKERIEWACSNAYSYSQGEGISQHNPMDSTEEDRRYWASDALYAAVCLFAPEPIGIVTGLIGFASAYFSGTAYDVTDAGYDDLWATSYWGGGIGNFSSPSRQYCFNMIRWIQKRTNPSSYYGIKIWAQVSLDHPYNNPYDVDMIWVGPIHLKIHRSHKLSISTTSGGNTEPLPGSYHYKEGTSVTVAAYAYSGYDFEYWLLDGTIKYGNPITVTMNFDHDLTACFEEEDGGGGGCPYVSAWDGDEYVLDNNLLAASEAHEIDITDYYKLEQRQVSRYEGRRFSSHSLLLSEFENEHSYLDQFQLLAVDHSSDVNAAVSPYGEILTYMYPHPPVSAITNAHENVKKLLSFADGNYYEGYNGSHITLNFGDELDVSQGAKLVLRTDMFCDKICIGIQVQDENGEWNDVASFIPRAYWATDIIDMSEHLPDARENLKVRLYFTASHKIDLVGLDTSPQATIDVKEGQLVSAVHSVDGCVTALLRHSDDNYAELLPRQKIELMFTVQKQTMEARDYVIILEGHYYIITS